MFQIKFYVDDKNLGEVFKRLAGIARGLEHVYVPNLEPKPNGKTRVTAADSTELFVKELRKRKLDTFDAKTAREICVGMGFSSTSYSYVLKNLAAQGVLKKAGNAQNMKYTLKAEK